MPGILESVISGLDLGVTTGVRTALPYLTQLSLQGSPLAGNVIRAKALGGLAEQLPSLSANEIIRRMRAAGLGVRRQAALKVISALKDQIKAHEYIQSLRDTFMPKASAVPLAGQRQTFRYHVRIAITGTSQLTGEERTQFITVTSTRLISKQAAIDEAVTIAMTGEQYDVTDITDTAVIAYTRQNPSLQ